MSKLGSKYKNCSFLPSFRQKKTFFNFEPNFDILLILRITSDTSDTLLMHFYISTAYYLYFNCILWYKEKIEKHLKIFQSNFDLTADSEKIFKKFSDGYFWNQNE